MAIIYHLTPESDWESARLTPYHQPESLAAEGFIHCSQDEDQMLGVANRLFAGRNDMLALDVDTGRLTSPVKYEHSRSGGLYPHIYGPLNTEAVLRVRRLSIGADGKLCVAEDH